MWCVNKIRSSKILKRLGFILLCIKFIFYNVKTFIYNNIINKLIILIHGRQIWTFGEHSSLLQY